MGLLLFHDTETTGLPNWNLPSEHPTQPRICQWAMLLVDEETRRNIAGVSVVIAPDGWELTPELTKIHGLTTADCRRFGVPISLALSQFLALALKADTLVGHNVSFDQRMARIELKRASHAMTEAVAALSTFCTQRNSKDIIKLAATAAMHATGRHGSKAPKLTEAYEFFTGRKFEKAHEAMADVVACKTVYFAIRDHIGKNGMPAGRSDAPPMPTSTPVGAQMGPKASRAAARAVPLAAAAPEGPVVGDLPLMAAAGVGGAPRGAKPDWDDE